MSLLSSLINSAESLRVFERALTVSQNNVANANTPGYARQTQTFEALSFDPLNGLPGGVKSGELLSSRDRFAEQAVWHQQQSYGYASQRRTSLSNLESAFPIGAGTGVSGSLNALFQAFSQLSVSPNDPVLRQNALDKARDVAASFQQMANRLSAANSDVERQIGSTVDQIDALRDRLSKLYIQQKSDLNGGTDAGIDAAIHSTLEELSALTDFVAVPLEDGSFSLSPENFDHASGGKLGALIELRDQTIPSYVASLNALAASVADRINSVLAGGVDQNGNAPAMNLFSYGSASNAASTIAVGPLTPDQLALALPSAPGGNGNIQNLSNLAAGFTASYSQLAAQAGRDLAGAIQSQQTAQQALDRAKAFRSDISGVSLDQEAALMLQFQRAYQASAQMFRTINEMLDTLMSLAR